VSSRDRSQQAPAVGHALPTEMDRNEAYLAEINSRIARLAISLHVPLASDEDIRAALHALAQDVVPAPADGSLRRDHALRAELRGLLVMRYGAEQRLVEHLGVAATQKLMADTEARLQREGFQPGADGVNLNHLFDPD